MSESFNKQTSFNELLEIWFFHPKDRPLMRTRKSLETARKMEASAWKVYFNNVSDEVLAGQVLAWCREVVDSAPVGKYLPSLAGVIMDACRSISGPPKPPDVSYKSTLAATETVVPRPLAAVDESFDKVWAAWIHPVEWEEFEASARSTFREVCRIVGGSAEVERACLYFAKVVSSGLEQSRPPMTVQRFLETCPKDETLPWWRHYLRRSMFSLNQRDGADFEAAYAWYPNFDSKEARKTAAAREFVTLIRPESRFDFLLAVKAYRDKRRDDSRSSHDPDQFTMYFSRFLHEWRTFIRPRQIADALTVPLSREVSRRGPNPWPREHFWDVVFVVAKEAGTVQATADELGRRLAAAGVSSGCVAVGLDEAYRQACVPPPNPPPKKAAVEEANP